MSKEQSLSPYFRMAINFAGPVGWGVLLILLQFSSSLSARVIEEVVEPSGWRTNRFPGPFQSIEPACRQEVYLPGFPNGNYVSNSLAPQYSAYACYCHSNPAPSIGGFVYPNCPAVGGEIISSTAVVVDSTLKCRVRRDYRFFVSAIPPAATQCGRTCNSVGDPINSATGAVYDTVTDFPESGDAILFQRFYDSVDVEVSGLGRGWRHSFSRNVKSRYAASQKAYFPGPDNSSLFNDEALACTNGFSQIKSRVSTWANATATYADGVCSLQIGTTAIGTLPLYSNLQLPPASLVLIGVDVVRDDGELVSFTLNGSAISPPPGINLKLQQTGTGYTVQEENDAVEAYDVSGRLLSITSRAGVVQTMGYDLSGRLSTVTDSFGHSLMLSYDGQGRLAGVTRQ